jgi:hypothetical protein
LGSTLVLTNYLESGWENIDKAIASLESNREKYEDWHYKIIKCGIHLKTARAVHSQDNDSTLFAIEMLAAKRLADELERKYKMGMRKVHYQNQAKEFSFSPWKLRRARRK